MEPDGTCDCSDDYAYWNTPDETGLTRRQRKYAKKIGVTAEVEVLAALPCLGGPWDRNAPCCINGSCVTCEARRTEGGE